MTFLSFFKSQQRSDSGKCQIFNAQVIKINYSEKKAWILYQEESFLISLIKSPFIIFPKINSFIDVLVIPRDDQIFKETVTYYPLHFYQIDSVYFDSVEDFKNQKALFSQNDHDIRKNI